MSSDSCMCSVGRCQSTWGCEATSLCGTDLYAEPTAAQMVGVTLLACLVFDKQFTRNKFLKHPEKAYEREMKRILFLKKTMTEVGTQLPFHVMVGGDRYPEKEVKLLEAGVTGIVTNRLRNGSNINPPAWASKWHRLSFNKIGALGLTQFKKVILLDNDMGLLKNVDHLAAVAAPAAAFHLVMNKEIARITRTAITTGLMILGPSESEYERAIAHLGSLNYNVSQYDGGDEEFWHHFYPIYNEVPPRYHAHLLLPLNASEWTRVRVIHVIGAFAGRGWHVPKNITSKLKYY